MSKTLIVIQGPTAVGKTSIATDLAKKLNTDVINADSRQVFMEMQIGTARPNESELSGVKHHLMGYKSILDEYNAEVFAKDARIVLEEIFQKKPVAILCGGSGFYIRALLENMDHIPDIPKSLRAELSQEKESNGLEELLKELKSSDPEYYELVDQKNSQRIIRAIEVIRHTGKPFSSFHTKNKKPFPYKIINFAFTRERENLYLRINKRVDEMMEKGLLSEVEKLEGKKHLNALQTVGYSEIFEFLDNKATLKESVELIKRNTRRFAKRQLTWLRRYDDINWINLDEVKNPGEIILKKINGLA